MEAPQPGTTAWDGARSSEDWLPLVYGELRRLAVARMARESPGHTLQPTALVHEAWLRLEASGAGSWDNRRHFFSAAAEAMRRILVDRARKKGRLRHGGEFDRVDLDALELVSPLPDERLLDLHEALGRLAEADPRAAEVVKLRFFLGMTEEEVAVQLGVSVNTVERIWKASRLWLYREISEPSSAWGDSSADGA